MIRTEDKNHDNVRWCWLLSVCQSGVSIFRSQVEPSVTHPVPIIPRRKFFGNPSRFQGLLSPDGSWLSWIAPLDGVLNIWVAPAKDLSRPRVLTEEKKRPIRQHFWASDSAAVFFLNDKDGDENFLLYDVDVATGMQRLLTPFE